MPQLSQFAATQTQPPQTPQGSAGAFLPRTFRTRRLRHRPRQRLSGIWCCALCVLFCRVLRKRHPESTLFTPPPSTARSRSAAFCLLGRRGARRGCRTRCAGDFFSTAQRQTPDRRASARLSLRAHSPAPPTYPNKEAWTVRICSASAPVIVHLCGVDSISPCASIIRDFNTNTLQR